MFNITYNDNQFTKEIQFIITLKLITIKKKMRTNDLHAQFYIF